jgi:hypothetical protein
MGMATPWTAARRLFGLSYYKAGQLQAPCSAFAEDPEPRPTNPRAPSGCLLILALLGLKPRAESLSLLLLRHPAVASLW